MNIPKELVYLWIAITVPVLGTGALLAFQHAYAQPVVVTRTVVVTPTMTPVASPSAQVVPTKSPIKAVPTVNVLPTKTLRSVAPTVAGGVK